MTLDSPLKAIEGTKAEKPKVPRSRSKVKAKKSTVVDKYIKSAVERQITRKVNQLNSSVLRTRNSSRVSHHSSVRSPKLPLNQAGLLALS